MKWKSAGRYNLTDDQRRSESPHDHGGAAKFDQAGALALIAGLALMTTGCSPASSEALQACNDYNSAGLGDPYVNGATRRGELHRAIGAADSAASGDQKWKLLATSLRTLDAELAQHNYDTSVGVTLAEGKAINGACANAGQKP